MTSQIVWRRNNETMAVGLFGFTDDWRVSVDYDHRSAEWSLIIEDVRPTDQAVYQCSVYNSTSISNQSRDVYLHVTGSRSPTDNFWCTL